MAGFKAAVCSKIMKDSIIWIAVTLAAFGLCAFLPVWIKNDRLRKKIYWFVLIPVSLVIIFYTYPAGMEIFGRWANR